MTNSDNQRRKRLYIILPIATIAVIAAIIIPMVILNRPIDKSFPAPEKFTNDTEAYAFAAVSSAKLLSADDESDELGYASKYLNVLDGFWNNDIYSVANERNTDESIPYYARSTVSGVDFDDKDFKYTLYYTKKVKSSSELRPDEDNLSALPDGASPAAPQEKEYMLRGVLPIGGKTYSLDGEHSPASENKRLTVTVSDGDMQVKCTRALERKLDFTSEMKISSVMTSSAAADVEFVPIFDYSVTKNGTEIERAKLMLYPVGGFSLKVERGDATYIFTAYRFTKSATITVTDGTKYYIEKSNGKYEFKVNI